MARNNNNRTSNNVPNPPSNREPQPANNDFTATGFSFPLPTEVVDLPSKGVFYGPNSTLYGVKELEIRYMTAKEEDILTSTTLARKGLTLDRLLQSLLVNKQIDLSEMLIGDRNALLLASRITGYGNEYPASVECSGCGTQYEQAVDLSELGHKQMEENTEISLKDGVGYVTLPVSKVEVGIKPITIAQEKWIDQMNQKKKKHKLADSALTDLLKSIVVSVNGIEDRSEISNFIDMLPARDSMKIRRSYKDLNPDVDLNTTFECPECGKEEVREIPIDAGFFWPDS